MRLLKFTQIFLLLNIYLPHLQGVGPDTRAQGIKPLQFTQISLADMVGRWVWLVSTKPFVIFRVYVNLPEGIYVCCLSNICHPYLSPREIHVVHGPCGPCGPPTAKARKVAWILGLCGIHGEKRGTFMGDTEMCSWDMLWYVMIACDNLWFCVVFLWYLYLYDMCMIFIWYHILSYFMGVESDMGCFYWVFKNWWLSLLVESRYEVSWDRGNWLCILAEYLGWNRKMWWNTLQKILRISSKVDQFRREDLSFGMPIVYVTRFVSDGSLDLFQFTWKVEPTFLGLEEPDCERKLWRYMKILQITEQRNEEVLPSGNWT